MENLTLKDLREMIDSVDDQILDLLCERFKLVERIGEVKAISGDNPYDPKRERDIIEKLSQKYSLLEKNCISDVYNVIFKYSKKRQNEVSN